MQRLAETLNILADGEFHSGEELAQCLRVSRGTVWKEIESVRQAGLDVFAVRGRGYRLSLPFELLDRKTILDALNADTRKRLGQLDLEWSVESTNTTALTCAKRGAPSGYTCVAELQTGGRGRRGRTWQSPIGGNIYLSQLWKNTDGMSSLGGLSLAVAVAVVRALKKTGITDVGVKWPNDILAEGKKLAGILLEVSGESSGPCNVVIGIGVNIKLGAQAAQLIDQPWTDLSTLSARPVGRNALVAELVIELLRMQKCTETQGLDTYLQEWRALDCYLDKPVVLQTAKGNFQGIVRGVDDNGALELACDGQLLRFHSGEVSLRAQ